MNGSDTNHSETGSPTRTAPIRGVALDMDGLLFDTERLYWEVGDTVLRRRGHRYCAELQQRMMGRVAHAAIQQMIDFHSLADSPDDLLVESDEIYGALLEDNLRPMPGVSQWIDLLSRLEIPFGLATSSRRKFVDVIFRNVDWSDRLSFTLTGDDVTRGKPDPQMYLKASEKLRIAPEQMLVLEDSGNGCAAGVAAGAITVAVPSEHTAGQNFDGAVLVADSLSDPRLRALVTQD